MTYCVAIKLKDGIVFCSDSRTHAGSDQVSTYNKMHTYGRDDERQFVLMSAGNLATTQAVLARLDRDIRDNAPENLCSVPDMPSAADYIGRLNVSQESRFSATGVNFDVSFILGGQIKGTDPMLMLLYPQGNYITTSEGTRYLQVGESKYGKPILDRIITPDTTLDSAAVCALVSMDSTMRSNISVGPPIELRVYRSGSLRLGPGLRLGEDSEYLRKVKKGWDDLIKEAFSRMPKIDWNLQESTR